MALAYDDVDAEQAVDAEGCRKGFEQLVMRNEQLVTEAPQAGEMVTPPAGCWFRFGSGGI